MTPDGMSRLVWRFVRGGAVVGLLAGGAFACFMVVASPHVPVGANLLWGPAGGALLGAAAGLALAGLWAGGRRLLGRAR